MNKVLHSNKNSCWCTPQDFFEILNNEFGFTLDPACTENSAKCQNFFTPLNDGLSQSWKGHTVFCNPPYGRDIGKWVKKALEESQDRTTKVIMLLPARTDTKWFHKYILDRQEIRFLPGRLKFTDEDGNEFGSAPFPSMVVVFNKH